MNIRPLALVALLAAPLALAQPAPNANPRAFKGGLSAECAKLRDEYVALAERGRASRAERGDAIAERKAARQRFEERCGKATPEMEAADAPRDEPKREEPKRDEPKRDDGARAEGDLPKKAGPAAGTGASGDRCAQLVRSMKDALARKEACPDRACRRNEQEGYERLRNAFVVGRCGEVPADAKPAKR